VLTDAGWGKVLAASPGHLGEVRRLVLDPLTKAQQQQLHRISDRIMHAVEPDKPPINERVRDLPHLRGRPTHAEPQCVEEPVESHLEEEVR
jgi:hypothetical protein